eukprot:9470015-Alexandrium_andersonii.AAC.1
MYTHTHGFELAPSHHTLRHWSTEAQGCGCSKTPDHQGKTTLECRSSKGNRVARRLATDHHQAAIRPWPC